MNQHSTQRRALIPLVLAALAPASFAQIPPIQPVHKNFVPAKYRFDWTHAGSGIFGRSVFGRFSSSHGPCAVTMEGNQPVFVFSTATNGTQWAVPGGSANDVAVVRGAASADRDALAVVSASGLELKTYVETATTPPASFTSALLDGGQWAGAKLVHSGDLDQDGDADLIGVASDGLAVLSMINAGGGSWGSSSILFALPATHVARDVALLNWIGPATPEIAVVSTWGVEVFDQSGLRLWFRRSAQTDNLMAVLRQADGSTPSVDRIALVYRDLIGDRQYLAVCSRSGDEPDVLLNSPLAPLDIVAVASGDRDNDGADDLLLSHTQRYDLRLLVNQRGPPPKSWSTVPSFIYDPSDTTGTRTKIFTIGEPSTFAGNVATPILADLDGQAGGEPYLPVLGAGYAVQFPWVDLFTGAPPGSGYVSGTTHEYFRRCQFLYSPVGGTLPPEFGIGDAMVVDLLLMPAETIIVPSAADAIELVVWRHHSNQLPQYLAAEAWRHYIYNSTGNSSGILPPPGSNGWVVRFPISLPDTVLNSGNRWYVEMRLVDYNFTSGSATPCTPLYAGGITLDMIEFDSITSFQYLTSYDGAWPGGIPFGSEWSSGVPQVGGFVPHTRIPPFKPGETPSVGVAVPAPLL